MLDRFLNALNAWMCIPVILAFAGTADFAEIGASA
jgi:hypothetical protein